MARVRLMFDDEVVFDSLTPRPNPVPGPGPQPNPAPQPQPQPTPSAGFPVVVTPAPFVLTNTNGNHNGGSGRASEMRAGEVLAIQYDLDGAHNYLEFHAWTGTGGETPAKTWAWASTTPGGPPLPGMTLDWDNGWINGSNINVVNVSLAQLRLLGISTIWLHDKVSDACYRWANVTVY